MLKQVKKWISLILMILIIIYIFYYIINNWQEFFILGSIRLPNIGLLFILFYFSTMVAAVKMLVVYKQLGLKNITLPKWLKIFVLARFLNRVVPQGGNFYRAITLKNHHEFSYRDYTLSFICFTWIDLLVNFFLISVIVILFQPDLRIGRIYVLPFSILITLSMVAFPAVFYLISKKRKSVPNHKILAKILRDLKYTITTTLHYGFLLKVAILSLICTGMVISGFWVAFHSIDIKVSLGELAMFTVIMRMGLIVSITPGNIGVIELAYGYLSVILGLEFSRGLIVAVLTRTVSFIGILSLGILFGGIPLVKSLKRRINREEEKKMNFLDAVSEKHRKTG
jgi:uncharacterized membrane protein YbhN (UPF0104 family)